MIKILRKVAVSFITLSVLLTSVPVSAESLSDEVPVLESGDYTYSAGSVAHNQQEAVTWAKAQIGKSIDTDGYPPEQKYQCVDLVKAYYQYLGVTTPSGNAEAYRYKNVPNGWTRVYGNYQPGDIAVWKPNYTYGYYSSGQYGHVAIVTSADSNGVYVVNQNFCEQPYCTQNRFPIQVIDCAIRPDFNSSAVASSKLQFWGIENNTTIKGSQRIFVKSTNVPSSEAMTVTVDGNYMSTEGQDPNGFYSFIIDTIKYSQSLHNITVSTNSVKETIYFYFSQEMVHAIDSPAEGITLGGNDPLLLTVSGWANNSEGKVSCKFYIDGTLIKTIADSELFMRPDIGCRWGYQFNTNVSNLQNGKHILTIETEVPSSYRTCKMNRSFYIKKSHTHSWNSGVVTKSPSCTVDGIRTYTCTTCGEEKTESISAVGHNYGEWKIVEEATVFSPSQQIRVCSVCGESERQSLGTKLEPTMEISETNILLRVKQSTRVVKVSGLVKGDAVQNWKSSNNKIVKVSGYANGTSLITAGAKPGNAVITVTLKSGMQKNIAIIVQKNKVLTEQIIGVPEVIQLKVKQRITLQNQVLPITSTENITYKSSNSRIATVNSKGQIVAKKKGTVVITVRSGKISVKCNVTVG